MVRLFLSFRCTGDIGCQLLQLETLLVVKMMSGRDLLILTLFSVRKIYSVIIYEDTRLGCYGNVMLC